MPRGRGEEVGAVPVGLPTSQGCVFIRASLRKHLIDLLIRHTQLSEHDERVFRWEGLFTHLDRGFSDCALDEA